MIRRAHAPAAAAAAAILLALTPVTATADALNATKSATVVSDPVDTIAPKAIPGAIVDYRVLFTNPLGNTLSPVRITQIDDVLPTRVILRVTDLSGTGKGPVEFVEGSLLGTGLLASGLTCTFTSLASTSDCFDFFDGSSWTYQPVPDADGFDANVRAIRVKPTSTFTTGGAFQIRYRVKIR